MKIHPEIDLTSRLKEIPGLVFTSEPNFLVDWEKMEIHNEPYYLSARSAETVEYCKFKDADAGIDFVKENKDRIIVYKFVIPKWESTPGWCVDPRPYLGYSKRPE